MDKIIDLGELTDEQARYLICSNAPKSALAKANADYEAYRKGGISPMSSLRLTFRDNVSDLDAGILAREYMGMFDTPAFDFGDTPDASSLFAALITNAGFTKAENSSCFRYPKGCNNAPIICTPLLGGGVEFRTEKNAPMGMGATLLEAIAALMKIKEQLAVATFIGEMRDYAKAKKLAAEGETVV